MSALAGCLDDANDQTTDDSDRSATPDGNVSWNWTTAPDSLVSRGEAACATDGQRLLVVGGFTDGGVQGVSSTGELFDLETGTWTAAPDLLTPLHHTGVAFVDDRFYVVGGYTGRAFAPTAAMWSWSPGEDAWTAEEPLPVPRGAHGVGVVDGHIYVVGGVSVDGILTRVDVYDVAARSWSRGPDTSVAREHLAVGAWNDTVYVAGGRAGSFDADITTFEMLDARNGTWAQGPELPTPRGGTAGAGTPHGFIVVGGEGSEGTFEEVERHDPASGNWTTMPADPIPRHGLCVAWMDDGLHVVNGGHVPGFAHSTTHTVLVPTD